MKICHWGGWGGKVSREPSGHRKDRKLASYLFQEGRNAHVVRIVAEGRKEMSLVKGR